MTHNIRLLEGQVEDDKDVQIAALQDELADVRRALKAATVEARMARDESARALGALRRQLTPLYRALQGVFGELDAAGAVDDGQAAGGGKAAQWEEWKARLGPSCAKVIDTLLLGGEMTVKAIKISARMGENTVYQATSKMGQAGILVKNGGKFSLKQL